MRVTQLPPRLFFALVLLLLAPSLALAATEVTSNITADTRWVADGSPYIVNFDSNPYFPHLLTVASGATLTIDPGVVVKFGTDNGISTSGILRAEGTANNPIIFTSLQDDTAGGDTNNDGTITTPTDEQWMHLQFNTGSNGILDHTIVRYGGAQQIPVPMTGIANYGGTLVIDHTTLTHNGYDGLGQYGGHTILTNSSISNHRIGIAMGGGELEVRDTRLYDNSASGIDHWSGALSIAHSEIDRNGIGIVANYQGSISVSNSGIHDNTTMYSPPGIDNRTQTIAYDENDNPYVSDPGISIDARNNWWGSASGPHDDADNPAGTGDGISGAVAYSPWLTSDPFASPDPCAAPGACASNVLFLPGIEASRLYRPDYAGGTDRLWEPNADSDARDLYLNPDGSSARFDVYAKDVIGEAYGTFNIYTSFLADLNTWKNADHIITDYRAIPYDWRLSLDDILTYGNDMQGRLYYSGDLRATSTPYVIQELKRLASSSKTGKVTIVAHSNGGLVAKALTAKLGSEASNLIDKILFVAVPQVGTPQAIGAILHGYDQGLPFDSFPLVLTPETARTLAKNMPSAYNLLPSFQYFTYTQDPVITFDNSAFLASWRAKYGDEIHSSERLRNFLVDSSRLPLPTAEDIKNPIVGNTTLLANAETLHNTVLDNWTPPNGVKLIEIAGWGEDTVKTIRYYQGTAGTCAERRADSTCAAIVQTPVLEYKAEKVIDGDGTVVVPSALWTPGAERYWVDLKKHNGFIRINPEQHHNILEVSGLRTLIQNLIKNSTSTLPAFISTTQPVTNSDKRLRFVLHSPLTLDLYDNLGNHTGISTTTGFLEENIRGSRYDRLGGIVYASAPASTTISLIMRGYAEGSFTLDMEETYGSVITASTTFAGIPSGTMTVATLTIPQGGGIASSSPLAVDENGDGAIDIILTPKQGSAVIPDVTSPEAVFAFSTTTNDIVISGTDDISSSVQVTALPAIATSTFAYALTDEAGNSATLAFKKIKEKENKNEREGKIKAKLLSIEYGTLSTTTKSVFLGNEIQYEWEINKDGSLKELKQIVKVKKDFKIRAKYDAKKNATKIYFVDRENKEKLKETESGLVLIRIMTRNGVLDAEY